MLKEDTVGDTMLWVNNGSSSFLENVQGTTLFYDLPFNVRNALIEEEKALRPMHKIGNDVKITCKIKNYS